MRSARAAPVRGVVGAAMLAALLLAGSPTLAGAPPAAKIAFLTNYVFGGRHSPFFLGIDRGLYRAHGLDVNVSPTTGSAFVIAAVESGAADYGLAEAASVVQAVAKGAKVRGFLVYMDVSTSGLASLAPFPTPQSVAGHPIAASLTDSARVILPILFARAGLDARRITWTTADPSVYFSLLLTGRADAITGSSDVDVPALRRVASPRGRTIYFTPFADWGYDVYGYFLVARADRFTSKPDEVRAFAAATAAAVRDAIAHPEDAARAAVHHSPALGYDTALAGWRESIRAIDTPSVRQHGYGAAEAGRLGRSIATVERAFGISTPLRPDEVYASGFAPR